MSSNRIGGRAVPTAAAHDGDDFQYRARLAERYEIMANAKKKLQTAFFFHTVVSLAGVAYALMSMNSEQPYSLATPVQMLMFITATLLFSPATAIISINQRAKANTTSQWMLYAYLLFAQLTALAEVLLAGWHVITPYSRLTGYHEQAWMGAVNLLVCGAAVNVMAIYYAYSFVLQSNKKKV